MKCPECNGTGKEIIVLKNSTGTLKACKACKGTGRLSKFQSAEMKTQLQQLREAVKNLQQSRDDLIARATELQGKLNAYKNDVEQALELASFYEKQALENEKLAALLKVFIGAMIKAGINVPDAGQAPKLLENTLLFLKAARTCVQSLHALKGEQAELALLNAIDDLFSLEKSKVKMTIKQVSPDEETKDLEPEKGGESDAK